MIRDLFKWTQLFAQFGKNSCSFYLNIQTTHLFTLTHIERIICLLENIQTTHLFNKKICLHLINRVFFCDIKQNKKLSQAPKCRVSSLYLNTYLYNYFQFRFPLNLVSFQLSLQLWIWKLLPILLAKKSSNTRPI